MMSSLVIFLLRGLAHFPLAWLRILGWWLGALLMLLAVTRRRVTRINLRLCFPDASASDIRALTFSVFVHFAQAWLDRAWLWHASPAVTRGRLKLAGSLNELSGDEPVVLFAPHFVGLDAGWTALTQQLPRRFNTIYTNQANKNFDAWILAGRQRFGQPQLFGRIAGVKPVLAALRAGQPLYLLPDMNFGPEESVFVPFYGVAAATVPSLSRFARLGRAKVVPVITRMTRQGYEVQILPAWQQFPTEDVTADTALMNQRLQTYIDSMPEQYFWVHKRFKDRPPGQAAVY